MPLADHLAAGTQETFRRTGTDMDSTAGLQDMQFFDCLLYTSDAADE